MTTTKSTGHGAMLEVKPGSDEHLQILMAPQHLQFLSSTDRADVLAYGRTVWQAALSSASSAAGVLKDAVCEFETQCLRYAKSAATYAQVAHARDRVYLAATQRAEPVADADEWPLSEEDTANLNAVVKGYVQPVPDHCDRITWRNRYYHLPLESALNAAPPAAVQGDERRVCRDCADFGPICPNTGEPCESARPAPAAEATGDMWIKHDDDLRYVRRVLEAGRGMTDEDRAAAIGIVHGLRTTARSNYTAPAADADLLESAIAQAQQVLGRWNEWYGQNGADLPLPSAGIPSAQDALAEARSVLATRPAAPLSGVDTAGTVADRLDRMADVLPGGSQQSSDLRAAATAWRKHLRGPATPSPPPRPTDEATDAEGPPTKEDLAFVARGMARLKRGEKAIAEGRCWKAPEGWHCTRAPFHEGPCAAVQDAARLTTPPDNAAGREGVK